MTESRPPGWRRVRAVSEVLGVVVLFGLVLAGAALIVLFGVSALDQVEQQSGLEAAEDTLSDARAEFRTLAVDESTDRVSLSVPGDDNAMAVQNDGQLSFSLNGDPLCTATRDMGTLRYETDDGEAVAYQAGGLWRAADAGTATMVAPPSLDYRTRVVDGIQVRTLNVPVTNVNATESDVSGATKLVARQGSGDDTDLQEDLCLTGPNADRIDWVHNATIRVENNPYYRAWASFLREEFTVDGTPVATVTVDEDDRTVVASDIPLGAVNDDDNDGYPDPNLSPWNATEYHDRYADDPTIDNCPPEKDPGNSTRNPTQADADGDGWGDACDGFGPSPPGPGDAPPTVRFTHVSDVGNASTVVGDYTVNATDADGRVVSVSTALVAVDNGTDTVVADRDYPVSPNASQVTVTGSLANASAADSYWLVAVARDRNGSTTNVTALVRDNGSSDGDGDGVPDPVDDCPNVTGGGENGCAAVSPVGPDGDDALAVNASSATVTLLGSSVAEQLDESVTVRPPVDVSFALDGTGSMEWNDDDEQRVDATQSFIDELNSTVDRAGWVEFRIDSDVPGCPQAIEWGNPDDVDDCAEVREPLGDNFDDGTFIDDDDVNQDGGTYIGAGIDYGTDQLAADDNPGDDILVVLTDGANSVNSIPRSTLNQRTVATAQAAADDDVTIYPVGLGDDVNGTLLTQVATVTGGEYHPIDDDDELEDTFEEIAGDVTEGQDINRLELKRVQGGVEVGGPGSDTLLGDDLNDPSTSPTTTVDLGSGTNTSLVSLSNVVYECEGETTTVGNVTGPNGTTYEEVTCDDDDTVAETVDNGTTGHEIYRDGDPVPDDLGDAWYRDDIETVAGGYVDAVNDTFDLAPEQAVFVLRDGDNYTAVLFEADPSPPGGGSPTPPTVGPTPPPGNGGSPVEGIQNRFVVDIDGTEVVFDGD